VAGLLDNTAEQSAVEAQSLGQTFGQQGLGLAALLDAQATAIEMVAGRFSGAAQPIGIVSHYFSELISSFVITEQAQIEQQRA
jgi:hypothetical protein